ncbi:hypothetical protein [Roseomonas chloroacetimidivorans]|uniref:hypothetical protein n=1 Tax=Roseomonas chloroacetimidivorans TaxID=1766656 RepID=UPI003C739A21
MSATREQGASQPLVTFMAAVLEAGATYAELGEQYGISRDAARMRAVRAGLRSKHSCRTPRPITARRLRIAREMKAQGHDHAGIGERLGMSRDAVRMMLKRAGDA